MEFSACAPPARLKEANVGDPFANDDILAGTKRSTIDVDHEIAGGEPCQRTRDATLKFVVRCAHADRFPNGEREQVTDANRRGKRERRRARGGNGVEIERNAHADHALSFGAISRSRLPSGSTVSAMSQFGNVPTDVLVDAVEKHVAKMDDGDLAALLRGAVPAMAADARSALVASVFDAFRDRGESSDDAAEEAHTTVATLESGNGAAISSLIAYAEHNPGLLKEALSLFAQSHASLLDALPRSLIDGIVERF